MGDSMMEAERWVGTGVGTVGTSLVLAGGFSSPFPCREAAWDVVAERQRHLKAEVWGWGALRGLGGGPWLPSRAQSAWLGQSQHPASWPPPCPARL